MTRHFTVSSFGTRSLAAQSRKLPNFPKPRLGGRPGRREFHCFYIHNQVAYRARRTSGRSDLVEVPTFVWKARLDR